MRRDWLLVGIDLGTTVCKSVVFDTSLKPLASATRELNLITRDGGEVEQDAEEWWQATVMVVRQAVRAAGVSPALVKGICVSSQGISFVPVDSDLRPLRNAFSWLDTRAAVQRQEILEKLDEASIFSITGKRCDAGYVLPKLLWFREHEPELYARCHLILMPLDFLTARLTGHVLTDHTMASGTMIYDINRCGWSDRIVRLFALEPEKLPGLSRSGTPIGELDSRSAKELGLEVETVVAMGGQDQKVAALGSGIGPDRMTVSLGTAMAISQRSDKAVIDSEMRLPCFSGLFADTWVIEGWGPCCSVLDWLKREFFRDRTYVELNNLAASDETGSEPPFLFPFFSGAGSPHFYPTARGGLYGLSLSTSAGQIIRSVFEGVAFQVKQNLEVMETIYRPAQQLRIFGGGSKSDLWCQIIADVAGIPVTALATTEAATRGAAVLAGMAVGLYEDPEQAAGRVPIRRVFEPGFGAGRYRRLLEQYRQLQQRIPWSC